MVRGAILRTSAGQSFFARQANVQRRVDELRRQGIIITSRQFGDFSERQLQGLSPISVPSSLIPTPTEIALSQSLPAGVRDQPVSFVEQRLSIASFEDIGAARQQSLARPIDLRRREPLPPTAREQALSISLPVGERERPAPATLRDIDRPFVLSGIPRGVVTPRPTEALGLSEGAFPLGVGTVTPAEQIPAQREISFLPFGVPIARERFARPAPVFSPVERFGRLITRPREFFVTERFARPTEAGLVPTTRIGELVGFPSFVLSELAIQPQITSVARERQARALAATERQFALQTPVPSEFTRELERQRRLSQDIPLFERARARPEIFALAGQPLAIGALRTVGRRIPAISFNLGSLRREIITGRAEEAQIGQVGAITTTRFGALQLQQPEVRILGTGAFRPAGKGFTAGIREFFVTQQGGRLLRAGRGVSLGINVGNFQRQLNLGLVRSLRGGRPTIFANVLNVQEVVKIQQGQRELFAFAELGLQAQRGQPTATGVFGATQFTRPTRAITSEGLAVGRTTPIEPPTAPTPSQVFGTTAPPITTTQPQRLRFQIPSTQPRPSPPLVITPSTLEQVVQATGRPPPAFQGVLTTRPQVFAFGLPEITRQIPQQQLGLQDLDIIAPQPQLQITPPQEIQRPPLQIPIQFDLTGLEERQITGQRQIGIQEQRQRQRQFTIPQQIQTGQQIQRPVTVPIEAQIIIQEPVQDIIVTAPPPTIPITPTETRPRVPPPRFTPFDFGGLPLIQLNGRPRPTLRGRRRVPRSPSLVGVEAFVGQGITAIIPRFETGVGIRFVPEAFGMEPVTRRRKKKKVKKTRRKR